MILRSGGSPDQHVLPHSHFGEPAMRGDFEKHVFAEGAALLEKSQSRGLSFFDKNRWYKKILARTMAGRKFKTDLFRFIDVLPSLSGEKQLLSHFEEYLKAHSGMRAVAALSRLAPSFSARQIKKRIHQMAGMFIIGGNAEQALPRLLANWKKGFHFSMDILGEAVLSEKEADNYARKYAQLMATLCRACKTWPSIGSLEKDFETPLVNISVKPSALFSQIRPEAWESSKEGIKSRLRPLFRQAAQSSVFVNLDMERYFCKDLFLELFKELLMEREFKNYPHFGIVCQSYLKESFSDLKELVRFSKKRQCPFTVRLVKGAYWDSEILTARQKNQAVPVYTEKADIDANFEDCARLLLSKPLLIKTAVGSHNVRSIACAMALKERSAQGAQVEFQFLYGMGEALATALVERGFRARLYCAVGEMIPGMSYLVRRLLENSSAQSFILNAFVKGGSAVELLAPPVADPLREGAFFEEDRQPSSAGALKDGPTHPPAFEDMALSANREGTKTGALQGEKPPPAKGLADNKGQVEKRFCDTSSTKRPAKESKITQDEISQAPPAKEGRAKQHGQATAPPFSKSGGEPPAFANHRVMDFSQKANRRDFEKALENWRQKFPIEVPAFIEGRPVRSQNIFKRPNPARNSQTVSLSYWAGQNQVESAVQSAKAFFEEWSRSAPSRRIACLRRLARFLREEEFSLSALQVFEVGKTWAEACADTAEAIDFCEYYALSYERVCRGGRTAPVSGEESFFRFEAIGPAVVIAPWNFPLAILTGMTVAPLVCGNPVLIKPAEQSPVCGLELARLLLKSGFPPQSFAFLPGRGEEIGALLAGHPETPIVSFTGSLEVGKKIIARGGVIAPDQTEFKKSVVEMGGKNAIVIDSSADLDEAVSGVLASAFGFQGQKCSACSRLIVLESVYERFMARFLPAVADWQTGPPEDPRFQMGPLVDEDSYKRVRDFIKKEKSPVLFKGDLPSGLEGWFQPPVVFSVEGGRQPLWWEELFAPVLACRKVKDFDTALEALNDSCFGLTAGLYSRRPSHIERFKQRANVGNVYINRNCTGALVERHPFGGWKMSGLGSKAGGPDYIKQFLRAKTVTENSMRRGFAPELFEEDFSPSASPSKERSRPTGEV